MNDAGSLQNLNDIVPPSPPPWWPPAPGWYLLMAVTALLLLWLAYRGWRRWRADRYRREALAELAAIRDTSVSLEALPALLKRTALAAWPRAEVASLSGDAWHHFLDRTAPRADFSDGLGPLLDRLSYGEGRAALSPDERRRLLDAVQHWLRRHQAPQTAG
jgi:hypothetical protein